MRNPAKLRDILMTFGGSISRSDISQSNCCQVMVCTSERFLDHRYLLCSTLSFLYNKIPIQFAEQYFDMVTLPAAKKVYGMVIGFLPELTHYDSIQAIQALPHIGVACEDVDICCTGNITNHRTCLRYTAEYSV